MISDYPGKPTIGQFHAVVQHHSAEGEQVIDRRDEPAAAGFKDGRPREVAASCLVQAGHPGEALALLADSITFNFEKGSPIGLAFNRRAFETLVQAAAQVQGPGAEQFRSTLQEVESRLGQAESVLGRLVLPGEVVSPAAIHRDASPGASASGLAG